MAAYQIKTVHLGKGEKEGILQTEHLLQVLESEDNYDSQTGFEARENILQAIRVIVHGWVDSVGKEKKVNFDILQKHGTQLLAFGGHQLGVVMKNGDLDCVCIVPKYVTHVEFFQSLTQMLQSHPGVERLRAVEGAYVPIIQMVYNNTEVDLCLATTSLEHIPEDFCFIDDQILAGMDPVACASLNGVRSSYCIRNLIPNYDNFCVTLKVIKLWAKRQGLHHSAMAYLGGVAWAIMVVKVCQLYPHAPPAQLVRHFFKMFSEWAWPQPVLLRPLSDHDDCNLKPWNPKKFKRDTYHVMPVISPAYPEKNTTFSVTNSAKKVTTMLLIKAGCERIDQILKGDSSWSDLLQPFPFFFTYKHFLLVRATAKSDKHLLDWSGLVESRLRVLVTALERQDSIQLIHLWAQAYPNSAEMSSSWFLGLRFTPGQPVRLDIAVEVQQFEEGVETLARERRFYKAGMALTVQHVKRKDLAKHLPADIVASLLVDKEKTMAT